MLAQADPLDNLLKPEAPSKTSFFSFHDGLLVMGIITGLAVILFLWVYFTRRKPRRHLESSAKAIYREENEPAPLPLPRPKARKRRRGHPDNLPRNPTLGETGGLPPIRSEEPNGPAS
jgi:hypothetical protein